MRVLALVVSFWAFNALADELPKNLLMKCEGNLTILGLEPLPLTSKFETTLKLKDGELSDVGSIWLTTKECELKNGVVHCTFKSVAPSTTSKGSEKRDLAVFIARETGEYNHFLETWTFEGRNASGKQTGNMKWHRQGICRPISSPIF